MNNNLNLLLPLATEREIKHFFRDMVKETFNEVLAIELKSLLSSEETFKQLIEGRGMPRYLGTKEVMKMLNITAPTLRKLRRQGKLKAYSIEGRIKIDLFDVLLYMKSIQEK